jgi:hypothetical protein
VAAPVLAEQVRDLNRYGWLVESRMTPDGAAALDWIAANAPPGSRVLTPEVTYGSQLLSVREIVSEGKGTLESPEVTDAAIDVLTGLGRFYLPTRDPSVLSDHAVDFVLTAGDRPYAPAQFGGVPLLRTYPRLVGEAGSRQRFLSEPYLTPVFRAGRVRVFAVDRSRLPTVQVDRIGVGMDLPDCAADRCYTYIETGEPCIPAAWTLEPGVCVATRIAPSGQAAS